MKQILYITWFNGKLRAMKVAGRAIVGQWEAPEADEGLDQLSQVMGQAIAEIGYRGKRAAFVLVSRRLVHQVIETPPVGGSTLERFLARKVTQLNPFEEGAVWSYQRAGSAHRGNAVVLHLLPRSVFDKIAQACRDHGLHLAQMVPATSILESQISQFPIESSELTLLAAETEGSLTVIAGQKGGGLLFARSLNATWESDPDRVTREINRSLLYARQQFGTVIRRAWWYGNPEAVEGLSSELNFHLEQSPMPLSESYWVEEAVKISPKDEDNLVPEEMQTEPRRRAMVRVAGAATAVLFLGAVAATVMVEISYRREKQAIGNIEQEIASLEQKRNALTNQIARLEGELGRFEAVDQAESHPIGGWILSYLGNVMPNELVLTRYRAVPRDNGGWEIELEGRAAQGRDLSPRLVDEFQRMLEKGPYHFELLQDRISSRRVASGDLKQTFFILARCEVEDVPASQKEQQVAAKGGRP